MQKGRQHSGENCEGCQVVGAKDAEWASTLMGRFRMH